MPSGDSSSASQSSSHVETIRECLALLSDDPETAWHQLVPLVYERIRRLTSSEIKSNFPILQNQTGDVPR